VQQTIQVLDANGATQTIPVTPPVGQTTGTQSSPVVIASDQVVPISFSGTQPVSVHFPSVQTVSFGTNPQPVFSVPIEPSFSVSVINAAPTSGTNLLVITSGASAVTRLRRLTLTPGFGSLPDYPLVSISRTTGASSGGTALAGSTLSNDLSDSSYSGTVRVGGFSTGGMSVTPTQLVFPVPTPGYSGQPGAPVIVDFTNNNSLKGFALPSGGAGALFAHSGITGANNFSLRAEWVEEIAVI
jgi:hypothetical protein